MTRTTNARIAGFTFLFYIATGIAGLVLFGLATKGDGTAAKLANIAGHAPHMRVTVVLSLLTIFEALILAVTLFALTRDIDPDLARLALMCRVTEGVINAIPVIAMLALLSVAMGAATAAAPGAEAANALCALLLKVQGWSTTVSATVFAVGSTLYSYLFLRARSIPVPLAWLGVLASVLLVVTVPLEGLGLIKGPVAWFIWLPALVFEVTLGLWLLIKGVAAPAAVPMGSAPDSCGRPLDGVAD